jgi:amino acid transporter
LAFAVATVAVLLIAHTFVRLTQRFNHSGSVYGFVGATLGPRPGALSGWLLVGTYTSFGVVTCLAAGIFTTAELRSLHIWNAAPDRFGFVVGGVVLAVVLFLASRPARSGTRIMLVVESVTITLVVVLAIVIVARVASGNAPSGQSFTLDMFSLPSGAGRSSVFLGVVFAFLSFAGFEAAATLGEEAKDPRKDIPRAILGTALFGGVFFVLMTAVEVLGFGANQKGMSTFTSSGSLLGDLGEQYVGSWIGDLITLGAIASAIACCLACVLGASRLTFALSRDGMGPAALGEVSVRHAVPARAVAAVIAVIALAVAFSWVVLGARPFDVFFALGTSGTLILLVAYVLATLGGIRLLFFSGQRHVGRWEIVIPVLSLCALGYTLFRNLWPLPEGQAWWGPGVAVAWLLLFLLAVLARPAAAKRAGELLTRAEGLNN